jgi:predicted transcriptional regulator
MAVLDLLAPDQRAVVGLVLQQGRSYQEIADLLGISRSAVRARAHAGLAALAPRDAEVPADEAAQLADFLLGQQDAERASETRELIAESADARTWATRVGERLREIAPDRVPAVTVAEDAPRPRPRSARAAAPAVADPAPAAAGPAPSAAGPASDAASPATAAAGPAPSAAGPASTAAGPAPTAGPDPTAGPAPTAGSAPPRSSKLGGILLIAGAVIVVAVVLAFVFLRGDDDKGSQTASQPTATPTATATPRIVAQVPLTGVGSASKAKGTMTVFLVGQQLGFQIEGQNVPPNKSRDRYGVWFTGPGGKTDLIGVAGDPVGSNGALGVLGPPTDKAQQFPQQLANHRQVVVSRETKSGPRQPGPVILRGKLPTGSN